MQQKTKIGILFVAVLLTNVLFSSNLIAAWNNREELTSNPAPSKPIVDGIADSLWYGREINSSNYQYAGNKSVTLYVTHYESALYIMVEVRYVTTFIYESISLYISKNNLSATEDFIDKKRILLNNANLKDGSDTFIAEDYYLDSNGNYISDSAINSTFEGAAKVKLNGTTAGYRFYEFKMNFNSFTTEDAPLNMTQVYAFKLGLNNTNDVGEELISVPIIIQIGPRFQGDKGSGLAGEFKFDAKLYIQIVVISVTVLFGVYGILIVISKKNITFERAKSETRAKSKSVKETKEESEETGDESEDSTEIEALEEDNEKEDDK